MTVASEESALKAKCTSKPLYNPIPLSPIQLIPDRLKTPHHRSLSPYQIRLFSLRTLAQARIKGSTYYLLTRLNTPLLLKGTVKLKKNCRKLIPNIFLDVFKIHFFDLQVIIFFSSKSYLNWPFNVLSMRVRMWGKMSVIKKVPQTAYVIKTVKNSAPYLSTRVNAASNKNLSSSCIVL